MDSAAHWEKVYTTKSPDSVSWYRPHLDRSLALIAESGIGKDARILDVGGGASTLAADLLALGYTSIAVLDIAETALATARTALGADAERIRWIAADLLAANLPAASVDLWHDRALIHFFRTPEERGRYAAVLRNALTPGGIAIIAAFAPDGPTSCSGLQVARAGAAELAALLGPEFALLRAEQEIHTTPSGSAQAFLYAMLRRSA